MLSSTLLLPAVNFVASPCLAMFTLRVCFFFFFNNRPPTEISPFPLPDALPICADPAVARPRAGPAARPPLTDPPPVPPPPPRRDEPADLAAVLRHRELEGRTAEQLIGRGPQHGAYVGAGHPHVSVLEHDAQLADPARGRRAGDGDIGDALQPASACVHHRGKRPRQY